jgi:hypothetical protein
MGGHRVRPSETGGHRLYLVSQTEIEENYDSGTAIWMAVAGYLDID